MSDFLWNAFYEHSCLSVLALILLCFGAFALVAWTWPRVRVRGRREEQPKRSPLEWIETTWPETAKALLSLSPPQITAYTIVVCRRLQPAHEAFHQRTGSGDPALLAAIREHLFRHLRGEPSEHERLVQAMETLHAGEEDDLRDDSDAIDAAVVHAAALDTVEKDIREVLWLMDTCLSAAHAAEEEAEEEGAVQREREWQHALIESLRTANTPDELTRIAERAV